MTTKSNTNVNEAISSTHPNGVDPKLLFLVRKLLSQKSDVMNSISVVSVVNDLRAKHREYQRHDMNLLTSNVEAALNFIRCQNEELDLTNDRKRKVKPRLQNEDNDYENAALVDDEIRENFFKENGRGLNDGLRGQYRQIQLDRDRQQRTQQEISKKSNDKSSYHESGLARSIKSLHESGQPSHDTSKQIENALRSKECKNASLVTSSAISTTGSDVITSELTTKRRRIRNNNAVGRSLGAGVGQSGNGVAPVPRPLERYSDLGGMNEIIKQIRQLVEYPLVRPELYQHLGVDPPRGVLLRGPPGTGKTHLANAVAGQLGVSYFRVSAPELVAGVSGESEGRIRDLFQAASDSAPSLIFMDELDVIAQKRGGDGRGMEKRMVAQLLTSMDHVAPANNRNREAVVVIAATNRPDAMDSALRRAGRFDKEILLGVPDEAARERIISTVTSKMRLDGDFDCKVLARKTPGYVGADIKSLAKEAAVIAIDRIFRDVLQDQDHVENTEKLSSAPLEEVDGSVLNKSADKSRTESLNESGTRSGRVSEVAPLTAQQMDPLYVTMEDFLAAVPLVQPSAQREGFATVPDVTWDDVGALHSIREELKMSVLEPIRHPERFHQLGLSLPAGVLLYGPPGCGKTLLAKAVAHESGANFISVKGPELLDKYVGESERAVRLVFERARSSSPCIIFFDELDSLVPRRGSDGSGSGGVSERVVNQLLTEMDGLESRRSVFVIAATNRPELIDPAMMRPGRLDKLLYVPLPTPDERVHIIGALAKKVRLHDDVDLESIARSPRCEGYSGADCAALLREAGLSVLKEELDHTNITAMNISKPELSIASRHFENAFHAVMPSVSRQDQVRYDRTRDRMANARSRGSVRTEQVESSASDQPTKLNVE